MRLSDLLRPEWVVKPLPAADFAQALGVLAGRLVSTGHLAGADAGPLVEALGARTRGDVVPVADDVVLVLGRSEGLPDDCAALGVTEAPVGVGPGSGTSPATARVLLMLLTPRRLDLLRERVVPAIVRVLRDGQVTERMLSVEAPADLFALTTGLDLELDERLLVEDALTPVRYRIYPDTPLAEVVDLMVRRGLHAVPVVGENYQVLGIITAGDALRHLLPGVRSADVRAPEPERPGPLGARDVMTRTVMCVSEDQSLIEAANLMVNRGVEQLPVVREGELIGFLTRDVVLRRLFRGDPDAR